jgi:septal ring factor EnvC (AmiA/AmiB activator)
MRRSESLAGFMAAASTTAVIAAALVALRHVWPAIGAVVACSALVIFTARLPVRRTNAARIVALTLLIALACLPGVAHAQSTQDPLTQLRTSVDATAQRWFDAHNEAASLDTRISGLEESITGVEARVAMARKVATARALLIYTGGSLEYASVFGTTVIESVRRAELIDHANEQNVSAIEDFTASLKELHSHHDDLVNSRARLDKVLQVVASQRDALDAQLASLQRQATQGSRAGGKTRSRRIRSSASIAPATAAPTAPVPDVSVLQPPAAPPPSGGGVSRHHNDPFLVCTRGIESRGNYGVVSPDGTYYGGYQFLPSTWNVTAAHAGRLDLVGVLPSNASAYDQDEMAWALYQWQGKGPWGGRC